MHDPSGYRHLRADFDETDYIGIINAHENFDKASDKLDSNTGNAAGGVVDAIISKGGEKLSLS